MISQITKDHHQTSINVISSPVMATATLVVYLAETYRRTPQVFRVRTRHLSDLTGETHLISSNFPTRKRIRMLCLFLGGSVVLDPLC